MTNLTQGYETSLEEGLFIFVQTTLRNSDGQLIAYLESSKFTDLNFEAVGPFLDHETSRGNDPIVEIDGEKYQVIRRVQSNTVTSEDLGASTILSWEDEGNIVLIARFAHDGYPIIPGDKVHSIWTFVKPVE